VLNNPFRLLPDSAGFVFLATVMPVWGSTPRASAIANYKRKKYVDRFELVTLPPHGLRLRTRVNAGPHS